MQSVHSDRSGETKRERQEHIWSRGRVKGKGVGGTGRWKVFGHFWPNLGARTDSTSKRHGAAATWQLQGAAPASKPPWCQHSPREESARLQAAAKRLGGTVAAEGANITSLLQPAQRGGCFEWQ